MNTFDGDVVVQGDLRVQGTARLNGASDGILRSNLVQENLTPFDLPPETWRIYDNMDALLPDPPTTGDDIGIVSGTFGTATPSLQTRDVKGVGAAPHYARRMVQLPHNYVSGETVTIRLRAGMITTQADTTATVDVECYKSNNEGAVSGSDLCATSAISCNSTTFADKDFTITPTSLSPGDWLDIRIAIHVNDGATVTVVKGAIGRVQLLCDTKG